MENWITKINFHAQIPPSQQLTSFDSKSVSASLGVRNFCRHSIKTVFKSCIYVCVNLTWYVKIFKEVHEQIRTWSLLVRHFIFIRNSFGMAFLFFLCIFIFVCSDWMGMGIQNRLEEIEIPWVHRRLHLFTDEGIGDMLTVAAMREMLAHRRRHRRMIKLLIHLGERLFSRDLGSLSMPT